MKIEEFRINKENPYLKIVNNPEDPCIKISSSGQRFSNPQFEDLEEMAMIQIEIHYSNRTPEIKLYIVSTIIANNSASISDLIPVINSADIVRITFKLENCIFEFFELDLIIQKGRDLINIKNPIDDFKSHISDRGNTKILFSGPFGQGKTTFLEEFFKQNEQYEVFKVFPVNYSVASNEDIFKYIKTDILFQLLGKGVEFDTTESTLLASFQEYIYLNPKKTIVSFLKNISHLNSNVEILHKSIEVLNNFIKPILDYHDNQNIDERSVAENYVKEIYEQEGSLFEDNFYTQLIRQLLERLKTNSKKENVLIIEDLDRMDPDHIFRILNVISAHYDNYNFNGQNEHHNKFGFDKIIIVCDVKNIENIFYHKYGEKTDFRGYMNKYFSTKPFEYDNKMMMVYLLENEIFSKKIYKKKEMSIDAILVILKSLIQVEQMTLREIFKLTKNDFFNINVSFHNGRYFYSKCLFTTPIAYLINHMGANSLMNKIQYLKQGNIHLDINFTKFTNYLITGLLDLDPLSNEGTETHSFKFKGENHLINVSEDHYNKIVQIDKISIEGKSGLPPSSNVIFNHFDFYDLLIENIKKYNQIENA